MKATQTTLLLAALSAANLTISANAEGLYGTAMIGSSTQVSDSEAYGNNLGVDGDFPGAFSTGDGIVGTLGLGYSLSHNMRVEARLGLHDSDFDSREVGTGEREGEEYILNGTTKSTTLTIEGFYDIPTSIALKPYLKAGFGAARNDYSARLGGAGVSAFDPFDGNTDGYYDAYSDETSTEFTWNVGVGGSIAINDRISVVGEYQYVSLGDAGTGQDSFTDGFRVQDASAHEVQLGLQVGF